MSFLSLCHWRDVGFSSGSHYGPVVMLLLCHYVRMFTLQTFNIAICLDFHSTKWALWLVDSWSRAPDQISNVSRPGYNCAVVARAPNTTGRDQCMTNLKMAWSSARAHVSLIDGGGPWNTASFQFQPVMIDNGTQWGQRKRFSRLSEDEIQNLI